MFFQSKHTFFEFGHFLLYKIFEYKAQPINDGYDPPYLV
jgi:hypothetical protein